MVEKQALAKGQVGHRDMSPDGRCAFSALKKLL